jgi:3-oxoadipate enol-lactonase
LIQVLEHNGAQLHYDSAGQGETAVFFIHAGICNMSMWDEQWDVFAQRYRVGRYDTRGWGKSATQNVEFRNCDDVIAVLDAIGIQKAVLIGCSRGGTIAMDTALTYPHRVSGLVMVCSAPNGYDPGMAQIPAQEQEAYGIMESLEKAGDIHAQTDYEVHFWVDGLHRTPEQVDTALRERVRAMILANTVHDASLGTPIMLEPLATERLNEIRVPTLIVLGLGDSYHSHLAAQAMQAGIANAQRVDFADVAHLPSMEIPQAFNDAVLNWLKTAVSA